MAVRMPTIATAIINSTKLKPAAADRGRERWLKCLPGEERSSVRAMG